MVDFGNARKWSHDALEAAVTEGSVVVDATMGNGYDTKWLCERVGETGKVYAFDIQQAALDNTAKRLEEANLLDRAQLILSGHERMQEFINESVDAIDFNLGWLPGTPHECTTRCETTLKAVNAGLELLKKGGLMTICVYPGHDEGTRERDMLISWASGLDDEVFDAYISGYLNIKKLPPLMIGIVRKKS